MTGFAALAGAGAAVGLFADLLSLTLVLFSLYQVIQLGMPRFPDMKVYLCILHLFFGSLLALDIMRNLASTSVFMDLFAQLTPSLVLWSGVLLSVIAYLVYSRTEQPAMAKGFRAFFGSRSRPHAIAICAILAYALALQLVIVWFRPYRVVDVVNIAGTTLEAPAYSAPFLFLAFLFLLFFISYPTLVILLARGKTEDRELRRAMALIPIAWTALGNSYFIFSGLVVLLGVDLISIGYLFGTLTFVGMAAAFGRTTLSRFFAPVSPSSVPASPFTSRLGSQAKALLGTSALLEFDPSTNYERVAKDFALEELSKGHLFFLFTTRGSPLMKALEGTPDIGYFVLSATISSPQEMSTGREILIPQNDQSIIVNLLGKVAGKKTPESKAVIFDNISNQILTSGLENAYRFVKQALEILFDSNTASLFLIIRNAHDERTVLLMESLFNRILVFDENGLRVKK